MKPVISNRGISAIPVLEGVKTIEDNSIQDLKFNVMHKKDVEEIESQIINIYDTFNQVNESVLQINVVRILEFVKNFMSGIKNTQGGIVKDLGLIKNQDGDGIHINLEVNAQRLNALVSRYGLIDAFNQMTEKVKNRKTDGMTYKR